MSKAGTGAAQVGWPGQLFCVASYTPNWDEGARGVRPWPELLPPGAGNGFPPLSMASLLGNTTHAVAAAMECLPFSAFWLLDNLVEAMRPLQ